MKEICRNCKYFYTKSTNPNNIIGDCRRYPPSGYVTMHCIITHIFVEATNWCGEWKSNEEAIWNDPS